MSDNSVEPHRKGTEFMQYINYILCVLLAWNLIVFIIYGVDKRKAIKSKRRISEKALLFTA